MKKLLILVFFFLPGFLMQNCVSMEEEEIVIEETSTPGGEDSGVVPVDVTGGGAESGVFSVPEEGRPQTSKEKIRKEIKELERGVPNLEEGKKFFEKLGEEIERRKKEKERLSPVQDLSGLSGKDLLKKVFDEVEEKYEDLLNKKVKEEQEKITVLKQEPYKTVVSAGIEQFIERQKSSLRGQLRKILNLDAFEKDLKERAKEVAGSGRQSPSEVEKRLLFWEEKTFSVEVEIKSVAEDLRYDYISLYPGYAYDRKHEKKLFLEHFLKKEELKEESQKKAKKRVREIGEERRGGEEEIHKIVVRAQKFWSDVIDIAYNVLLEQMLKKYLSLLQMLQKDADVERDANAIISWASDVKSFVNKNVKMKKLMEAVKFLFGEINEFILGGKDKLIAEKNEMAVHFRNLVLFLDKESFSEKLENERLLIENKIPMFGKDKFLAQIEGELAEEKYRLHADESVLEKSETMLPEKGNLTSSFEKLKLDERILANEYFYIKSLVDGQLEESWNSWEKKDKERKQNRGRFTRFFAKKNDKIVDAYFETAKIKRKRSVTRTKYLILAVLVRITGILRPEISFKPDDKKNGPNNEV